MGEQCIEQCEAIWTKIKSIDRKTIEGAMNKCTSKCRVENREDDDDDDPENRKRQDAGTESESSDDEGNLSSPISRMLDNENDNSFANKLRAAVNKNLLEEPEYIFTPEGANYKEWGKLEYAQLKQPEVCGHVSNAWKEYFKRTGTGFKIESAGSN